MSERNIITRDWNDHGLMPLEFREKMQGDVFVDIHELTEQEARDLERQIHERLAERD